MAWAGYLAYLFERGEVPDNPDEVCKIKADFLSGFREDTP